MSAINFAERLMVEDEGPGIKKSFYSAIDESNLETSEHLRIVMEESMLVRDAYETITGISQTVKENLEYLSNPSTDKLKDLTDQFGLFKFEGEDNPVYFTKIPIDGPILKPSYWGVEYIREEIEFMKDVRVFEDPIYPGSEILISDNGIKMTVRANTKNIFNVNTGGEINISSRIGQEITDEDGKTFEIQRPIMLNNIIFLDENKRVLPEIGFTNYYLNKRNGGLEISFNGMWNMSNEDVKISSVFANIYYLGLEK